MDELAFFTHTRGSVIAPAGCGKTELIARAVLSPSGAGALILTHTHAGVNAIRDRLRRLGVGRSRARVETIAGWCLRYCRAYPGMAQLANTEPVKQEWETVYNGAIQLLHSHAVRRVLRASYSNVFVDEYQDCTARQHAVIVTLSKEVPTYVLGDPLQGIFGFAGASLSWTSDIESEFPALGTLNEPWRWKNKNEKLGQWLLTIREPLSHGAAIDLTSAPLTWNEATTANQRAAAYALLKESGKVVAIHKWPREAHAFARGLAGSYPSMEEVDCNDLLAFAAQMDQLAGPSRAARLVRFASECFTEVSTALAMLVDQLERGIVPPAIRYRKFGEIVTALGDVATGTNPMNILNAMHKIEDLSGAKLFRRELWREAKHTLVEFNRGGFASLRQTAWTLRNRVRATGRALAPRSASRTLLIKGLEFDHALILNADEFEDPRKLGDGARHFYVAATRGARSLVVLSSRSRVQFSAPRL